MKNDYSIGSWLDKMGLDHPLVISGPCSAETEEQILAIAHQLKNTDATVLRAGLWKPRTRPGNFEGVGALGLSWLKKAKEETGLLTATEIANPVHAELAIENEVDILWIGARTSVSPFIVQEIAEALKGVDKIVLIKNPVNPDLPLWLGAVERLYKLGISKLGVIHRGFPSYEKSKYRNNPEWQIPIDLQNNYPNLPLILDPSHIAGKRDLIFELCQTALDLNYDGFMIESHSNPNKAWSDAKQQITPEVLNQLLNNLKVRKTKSNAVEFKNKLKTLRTQIDLIDNKIVETLGKRMEIVDSIGMLKNENNVAILQSVRWNVILDKMIKNGEENKLSEDFMIKLYKAIHQESILHQKKKMDN